MAGHEQLFVEFGAVGEGGVSNGVVEGDVACLRTALSVAIGVLQ